MLRLCEWLRLCLKCVLTPFHHLYQNSSLIVLIPLLSDPCRAPEAVARDGTFIFSKETGRNKAVVAR